MNLNNFLTSTPLYTRPLSGEQCAQIIGDELRAAKPSMIGRFGSVEINGVLFPRLPSPAQAIVRRRLFAAMENNAGFISPTSRDIDRFSELMISDMQLLDVLGSWRFEEWWLRRFLTSAKRVELKALEPYFSSSPWSQALHGKRVLVIHPFSETIQRQYRYNRLGLFSDERVLPKFASLSTIKAVQTIAGNRAGFDSWFSALEFMKTEIDKVEFDVAILGCGAYGFPLAAHIKRGGKKAVHMGGATQILFGIKGRRWDHHAAVSRMYNDKWVRPAPEEMPPNADHVENACYW